jgi:cytochrome c-type biogenesis protein CcmH/NrfG
LQHAVRLNPTLPGAHLFLGIAQYQQHELDSALASLESEVQLQPKNAEVLSWLGIVELARGDAAGATGPLDRAGSLAPADANILDLRARAHTQVAKECFQKLYELDPASWHVHRALAEIYSAGGQPEQAAAEYAVAVKAQPDNADLYDALGAEYQRSNKLDEAAKAYTRELELNPHSATALFQLGRIRVEAQDPSAGITLLREALEAHADPAQSYYFLGLGLEKTGQDQEAAAALESCLKEHPPAFIERGSWYALMRVYRKLNREADARHALAEFNRLQSAGSKPPQ